jgi:hypothetical protein
MSRSSRIFAALLVITATLFSQLAVAAHLCPMMTQAVSAETASADAMLASDAPCHQAQKSTALCKQHCTDNQRTVVDAFAQLPIAFVPTFAVPLVAEEEISSAAASHSPDFGLVHALGPPLAITHCRLRI